MYKNIDKIPVNITEKFIYVFSIAVSKINSKICLRLSASGAVEVCMGMGKTGIPWVPWDSHGNGSKISHGMGMGWECELSAWERELRRGSWKKRWRSAEQPCHQQL